MTTTKSLRCLGLDQESARPPMGLTRSKRDAGGIEVVREGLGRIIQWLFDLMKKPLSPALVGINKLLI